MFKRVFSIIAIICFICCGCVKRENISNDTLSNIIDRDKIIVGVKIDTPPFGYVDNKGKNLGFDVDLAHYLAKKILGDEKKVMFVPVSTSNRIMKLASRDVDIVIATMSVTTQRKSILDFSVPYHTAGQAMLVKKGSKLSSISELSGKKAIIVFGSTVEKSLRTTVPNIIIVGYKTYPEAVAALKAGKADAMIADDTILLGFAMNDNSIKILPKRYSKEPYAIALRKSDEKLLDTINIELKEALNNGEVKQLKAKWNIN